MTDGDCASTLVNTCSSIHKFKVYKMSDWQCVSPFIDKSVKVSVRLAAERALIKALMVERF